MGLFDDIIGSAVPGGNVSKSLGVALLSLLANRGGSGGGLSGLLGGSSSAASSPPPDDQSPANIAGGLHGLVQRFQQGGFDDVIKSWIGTGPNQPIAPNQLHQALGAETVDELSRQTGLPHQDLLSQLSQALPAIVDRLTPKGHIPDEAEMTRSQSSGQVEV